MVEEKGGWARIQNVDAHDIHKFLFQRKSCFGRMLVFQFGSSVCCSKAGGGVRHVTRFGQVKGYEDDVRLAGLICLLAVERHQRIVVDAQRRQTGHLLLAWDWNVKGWLDNVDTFDLDTDIASCSDMASRSDLWQDVRTYGFKHSGFVMLECTGWVVMRFRC